MNALSFLYNQSVHLGLSSPYPFATCHYYYGALRCLSCNAFSIHSMSLYLSKKQKGTNLADERVCVHKVTKYVHGAWQEVGENGASVVYKLKDLLFRGRGSYDRGSVDVRFSTRSFAERSEPLKRLTDKAIEDANRIACSDIEPGRGFELIVKRQTEKFGMELNGQIITATHGPRSWARKCGLKPGDLIYKVNDMLVLGEVEVAEILSVVLKNVRPFTVHCIRPTKPCIPRGPFQGFFLDPRRSNLRTNPREDATEMIVAPHVLNEKRHGLVLEANVIQYIKRNTWAYTRDIQRGDWLVGINGMVCPGNLVPDMLDIALRDVRPLTLTIARPRYLGEAEVKCEHPFAAPVSLAPLRLCKKPLKNETVKVEGCKKVFF